MSVFNPDKNETLKRLKQRWENGEFTQDTAEAGCTPVWRAVDDALTGNTEHQGIIGESILERSSDLLPHHKICSECGRTSRNIICDDCYKDKRRAL